MVLEELNSSEEIQKREIEIDKMTLLVSRMNESLQNPFLNSDLRYKYKAAVREFEKKIKILKGDIKAIHIINDIDMENVRSPKHFQHHRR